MHDLSYSLQQIFYPNTVFYKNTPIFYKKLRFLCSSNVLSGFSGSLTVGFPIAFGEIGGC